MKNLLPKVERYFKTALHTHTNITDGVPSPEEMKEIYKARGYQVLAITDHNVIVDHSRMNEENFLMLTGAEYNINSPGGGEKWLRIKTYHLNFIAKRPDNLWQPICPRTPMESSIPYLKLVDMHDMPRSHCVEDINAIIAEGNKQGFLVMYNHPSWSLHDYTDYAGLKGLWAMEISNSDATREGYNDYHNGRVYADLLNQGNRIFPVGSDDAHGPASAGGAWVMVGAQKLEYASVIEALEKGDFYASTGPEIYSLSIEDGKLSIECSDAQRITVESGTRFAKAANPKAPDKLLRSATFNLSKWLEKCDGQSDLEWVRVVVHGPYGQYATTRAFRYDELK